MRVRLSLALPLVLIGCSSPAPEVLLGGSTTGSYDGTEFTAEHGYAVERDNGSLLIILGNGNLYCGSENSGEPPVGHNAIISAPAFEVGSYGSVMVNMYENVSSFEGVGTNSGSLTLTEVRSTSLAGQISFTYNDR